MRGDQVAERQRAGLVKVEEWRKRIRGLGGE
jgi:hypothetical protein